MSEPWSYWDELREDAYIQLLKGEVEDLPPVKALVAWAREAYTELAYDARHDTSLTDLMERGKSALAPFKGALGEGVR